MKSSNLKDICFRHSVLTIFIAPPSWGKTGLILDIYRDNSIKILFVSPLRALANEFYFRLVDEGLEDCYLIKKMGEKRSLFKRFITAKKSLLIITPEIMNSGILHEISIVKEKVLIVLDELHLFYYWGLSFRPALWENFMGVVNSGQPILGLSATFDESLIESLKTDYDTFFGVKDLIFINIGNQKLRKYPRRVILFPPKCLFFFKNSFKRRLLYQIKKERKGAILVFCRFRGEVDYWVQYLKERGHKVIGCKGGEVNAFLEDYRKVKNIRCIFTTSALSHGVNLLDISKVFFSYPVENRDLWFQMVGRAGRRGEDFEFYGYNSFLGKKGRILAIVKAALYDFYIYVSSFW